MIGLIVFIVVLILIYRHYFPPIPKADHVYDYGIVLGCPCHADGTLCTSQKKRSELAVQDYKAGKFKHILIAGGAAANEYVESEAMKAYILQFADIPVQTETKSRNTFENMKFSHEITGSASVMIITSQTHARRACAIAAQFFDDYSADWYPDHKPRHIYREIISRILYIYWEIKKKFSR